MWRAGVDLEDGPLDQLRRQHGRRGDRYDLIVVAMQDQRWDVELRQVFGQVGLREGLDAEIRRGNPAIMPWRQNASRTPSEILASGLLYP